MLLLTVDDSEQDMLHSVINKLLFLHSNTPDRCIYIHIRNMFQKKCHKDSEYQGRYCDFFVLIITNSEQTFPKVARLKCAFSQNGHTDARYFPFWTPVILQCTLHYQFPF